MEATAIQTVFTIQRMAAGTSGPAEATTASPLSEKYWLKGTLICHSGAFSLLNNVWKFLKVHSPGHQVGVVELISLAVLKAPVTIQYKGKVKSTARRITMIRTATRYAVVFLLCIPVPP